MKGTVRKSMSSRIGLTNFQAVVETKAPWIQKRVFSVGLLRIVIHENSSRASLVLHSSSIFARKRISPASLSASPPGGKNINALIDAECGIKTV